mmetsp:Transcript_82466/g.176677  ORF Transcript_82466/g.176677 Transcript_82466/m.176677 type:complete len:257 (+) Transcript_82466:156-926(+)
MNSILIRVHGQGHRTPIPVVGLQLTVLFILRGRVEAPIPEFAGADDLKLDSLLVEGDHYAALLQILRTAVFDECEGEFRLRLRDLPLVGRAKKQERLPHVDLLQIHNIRQPGLRDASEGRIRVCLLFLRRHSDECVHHGHGEILLKLLWIFHRDAPILSPERYGPSSPKRRAHLVEDLPREEDHEAATDGNDIAMADTPLGFACRRAALVRFIGVRLAKAMGGAKMAAQCAAIGLSPIFVVQIQHEGEMPRVRLKA